MSQKTVFQVRTADNRGNVRVVHAYETEEDAKKAIEVMKARSGKRYHIVPVPNDPNQYWGINFRE